MKCKKQRKIYQEIFIGRDFMRKINFKRTVITLSMIVVIGSSILFSTIFSNAATSNKVVYDACTKDTLGQGQSTNSKQYKPLALLDYKKNTCMNKTKGLVDVYSVPKATKVNKITVLPKGSTATIIGTKYNFYLVETFNYSAGELGRGYILKSKVITGKEKIIKFINSHKSYFSFSALGMKDKLTVYSDKNCTKKYKTIKNVKYDEFEVLTFKSSKYVKIVIEDKGGMKRVYVKPSSVCIRAYVDAMY